jgi:hypothetical protein
LQKYNIIGTYMHPLGGNVDPFASSLFCLWLIDMSKTKSREIGNTKQKHNALCVGHHYAKTNTNNVNKT